MSKRIAIMLSLVLIFSTLMNFSIDKENNSIQLGDTVKANTVETKILMGSNHTLLLKNDGTVWAWGSNGHGQLGDGTYENNSTPKQVPNLIDIIDIACGSNHNLALKADGTVWTWGYNNNGQLGNGTTNNSNVPIQVTGLSDVKSITAFSNHSMSLKNDGTVWMWGYNNNGQLGNGSNTNKYSATQVSGLTNVVFSTTTSSHSMALLNNGEVYSWGYNGYGQLGNGNTSNSYTPVKVSVISDIKEILCSSDNSMALKNDGTVYTWGYNFYGQLGNGTVNYSSTPISILSNTTSIAMGSYYAMALRTDGNVWAWGRNDYGQLGNGANNNSSTPQKILQLSNIRRLFSGGLYSIAQKADGTVWTWGYNANGQLGDGTITNKTTPIQVSGLTGVSMLACNSSSVSVIKNDGTMWSWGNNGSGQLGDSSVFSRSTPKVISELEDIVSLKSNGSSVVALKSDGTVWTWGYNNCGQLGTGTVDLNKDKPVQVSELTGVNSVEISNNSSAYAIKTDGTVRAWGYNGHGQLGNGNNTNSIIPVQVSGLTNVINLVCSSSYALAQKSDGTVWAWGYNVRGQLGNSTTNSSNSPVQVHYLTNIISISAGEGHSLALKNDNWMYTWGYNAHGQIGNNGTTDRHYPGNYLSSVSEISNGHENTFARKTDGTVYAWGYNGSGQLGVGDTSNRTIPTQIPNMNNVKSLYPHSNNTIAIKNDGTVWAWGYNYYGQLGVGTTTDKYSPTQITGLSGITYINHNGNHSMAVKNDGTVYVWGYNNRGQLGDGTKENKSTPIQVQGLENVKEVVAAGSTSFALTNDGKVWSWGDNNYGQLGNEYRVHTALTPIKTQINVLAVAASQLDYVSYKRIKASWTVNGAAEGATYKLAAFDENDNMIKQNEWTSSLEDTISDLDTSTTYKIKVKTKDSYGFTTEWYEIATATTLTWDISLALSNITATTADLAITESNPETTEYQIISTNKYINQAGELVDTPVWISLPDKTITAVNLTPNTAYSFQVRARTSLGEESGYSTKASMEALSAVPLAPTAVEAKATSSTVAITWGKVEGAQSYEIYEDDTLVATVGSTKLSYIHKDLLPATYHTYKVRAVNTTGAGPWSSEVTIKTLDELPATPSNIATTATNSTITISWDAVAKAEYYQVEADGVVTYVGKKTSYTFTGYSYSTQHTYRIRSVNNTGSSSWSSYRLVTTTNNLPTIPDNVKIYVTKTDIYISWDKVTDAEGYDIEENGLIIDNSKNTYFSKTGLQPNTSKSYRIRAKNSIGNGSWSGTVQATTYLLDTPRNIKISEEENYITLIWDMVEGAEGYEVEIDGQTVESMVEATFTHSELTPETTHTYRIRAVNTDGISSWSNSMIVTTLPVKPGVPANITAISSIDSITLTWSAVPGATGYDVELDGILIYNGNKTMYVHEELDSNSQHTYRVRARTRSRKGDLSEQVLVSTLPTKPTAPKNIAVSSEPYIVSLSWDEVPGALSYDIEINGTITSTGTSTEYTHRNINENVQYRYRIRTLSSMGTSEWSGNILNSTLTTACKKGKAVDLGLGVADIDDFSKYTLMLTYDSMVMTVEDLCTLSAAIELGAGKVAGTDITIKEYEPGKIVFVVDKVLTPGQSWTGLINSIKFKAKATGGTTITYTVYENL